MDQSRLTRGVVENTIPPTNMITAYPANLTREKKEKRLETGITFMFPKYYLLRVLK